MNPEWHFALTNQTLWERLASPRSLGLLLWLGLALLTVALVLLTRTRWGQTKPLSKCIVLSVFAHILFLAYASGTKLVFDYPASSRGEIVRLSLLAPEETPSAESEEEVDDWEESFATPPAVMASTAPARKTSEVLVPEAESTGVPDLSIPPQPQSLAQTEPTHETAPVPQPQLPAREPPLPTELAVEPSLAESDAADMRPNAAAPLERLTDNTTSNNSSAPADESPLEDLLPEANRLQRLTDISIQSPTADSTSGALDQTMLSENRDPDGGAAGSSAAARAIGAPESVAALIAAVPTVRRLGDSLPLPDLFKLRNAPGRQSIAAQLGCTNESEAAVQSALAWLAANQEADGRWNSARHGGNAEDRVLGHDRQHAGIDADPGITGLAVLAFLGAGQTHYEGQYRQHVQRGLEYLIDLQKEDGSLAGNSRLFARMYCHGIAALSLSEALAMTGDERLQPFVERAMRYTVAAQHAGTGGWRYQPGDKGDTSQLGWQILALRSAELAGIAIPLRTRQGADRFLESVTSGPQRGLASYRAGESPSRSMTAEALVCRFFLSSPKEPTVREAVTYIAAEPPQANNVNLYYWYYATLALFQVQGEEWQDWNTALQEQLLRLQHTSGSLAGSWDPDPVWGGYGGRVYTTALAAMCLEVYYRYLPILGGAK
jgi:hypothetical protein